MHPARKPWDNSTRTPSRPPSSATTPRSRNVEELGRALVEKIASRTNNEGARARSASAASTPRTPRDARRAENVRAASSRANFERRPDDAPLTPTERTVLGELTAMLEGAPHPGDHHRPPATDGARRSLRMKPSAPARAGTAPADDPRSVGALRRVLRDARELISAKDAALARATREATSLRSRLVAERRRVAALERALGIVGENPNPNPDHDPATVEDADAVDDAPAFYPAASAAASLEGIGFVDDETRGDVWRLAAEETRRSVAAEAAASAALAAPTLELETALAESLDAARRRVRDAEDRLRETRAALEASEERRRAAEVTAKTEAEGRRAAERDAAASRARAAVFESRMAAAAGDSAGTFAGPASSSGALPFPGHRASGFGFLSDADVAARLSANAFATPEVRRVVGSIPPPTPASAVAFLSSRRVEGVTAGGAATTSAAPSPGLVALLAEESRARRGVA